MPCVFPIATPEPVVFKRGSTFSYLFKIPKKFDSVFFRDWIISCQLRIKNNTEAKGLIADINASWVDSPTSNVLLLYHTQTKNFKLGHAELDVRFESMGGHVIYAKTIPYKIINEVTQI